MGMARTWGYISGMTGFATSFGPPAPGGDPPSADPGAGAEEDDTESLDDAFMSGFEDWVLARSSADLDDSASGRGFSTWSSCLGFWPSSPSSLGGVLLSHRFSLRTGGELWRNLVEGAGARAR